MARKPRIHFPGAVYHVMLRGNAGQPVFSDDRDRCRLYIILQYVVEKFSCRIHAFCLMTNHIHLVIQAGDVPLSRIMQNLSLRYTKWINYSQSRTGHVFQGRYKALLLDADTYLMELVRYVHLNPVRAGMVTSPDDYLWSSHHGYLGKETIPWLTTDMMLSMFAADIQVSRNDYLHFIANGIGESRRIEFHTGTCEGRILGDDGFADDAFVKADQQRERCYALGDVVNVVCRTYDITNEQLKAPGKARPFSEARAVAAILVIEAPWLSLTDLGRMLNRNIAPLGRAARRILKEMFKDDDVNTKINDIRCELNKQQKVKPDPAFR